MEASLKNELKVTKETALKMVLWVGIAGMIMLFAALTSAYVVMQGRSSWMHYDLPMTFAISTAVILLSSFTMRQAVKATKNNNSKKASSALIYTLALGLIFAALQFVGWNELYTNNIVFAGKNSNPAGSFIYVFTGLHIAHLIGGIIALLVSIYKNFKQKYNAQNMLGIELCASYWHFLDGLWVYLFLFLLLVR